MWLGDVNDVMHWKRAWRIWGEFEKSQLVEFCLGGRRLTFARSQRPYGRCCTWFGGDGKVSIERWYLSPYVKKPFNSKVIKSFVPELRSRKWFSCFGIPMLSMCVMDIMNILCTFHVFMYGYVTFWVPLKSLEVLSSKSFIFDQSS